MPRSKPKWKFLRGTELLSALAAATVPVKWIVCGEQVPIVIPVPYAQCIVKAGTYEGKVHNGRVYQIREIDTRPAPVMDHHYREGRSMLQPYGVTKASVSIWDSFFAAQATASAAASTS